MKPLAVAASDDDDVVDDEGRPIAAAAAAIVDDDVVDDSGQPIAAAATPLQPPTTPGAGADLARIKAELDAEKANSPRSVLGWLGNIPSSGLGLLEGGYEMVRHPVETAKALGSVALGGVQKAATAAGADPARNAEHDHMPTFDAFLAQMKERYGGMDAIGNTLYEDPAGAALDLSGLLSGGSTVLATRMPQTAKFLASAARAIDPVSAVGSVARATGRGAANAGSSILGMTTGVGQESIRTAARGSKAFKAGMRGAIAHEDVLDQVHRAVGDIVERRRDNYRAQLAQIPQQVVIDLKPIQQEMRDALRRFNVRVVARNNALELDFSRSALRHSAQEMGKVSAAFDDLQSWGTRAGDTAPLGVDLLKQGLSEMVAANPGRGDAIIKAVHDRTRKLLEQQVPGYAEMTADYASASKFLDEVKAELSVGANAKPGAGIRKLATSLNQRSDYRRHLIELLDVSFGSDIKGAVAGLEMQPMVPRGLPGRISVLGGAGLYMGAFASPEKLAMALTGAAPFSPRLVGETLAAIATVRKSAAMQAAGDVVGTARRIIYNPATYRFVEEGTDAATERKQQLDEMGRYLTGQSGQGQASLPPPPSVGLDTQPRSSKPVAPPRAAAAGAANDAQPDWPWPPVHPDEFSRGRSENADLIEALPPAAFLPQKFKAMRSAVLAMPVRRETGAGEWGGLYGAPFTPAERAQEGEGGAYPNNVAVSRSSSEYSSTLLHELGHAAIIKGDIPEAELRRLREFYDRRTSHMAELEKEAAAVREAFITIKGNWPPEDLAPAARAHYAALSRVPRSELEEEYEVRSNEITNKIYADPSIPKAVKYYRGDRFGQFEHSMAELIAAFVANPRIFKARYPDWYAQLVPVFGREYLEPTVAEKAMMRQRKRPQLTPFEREGILPPPPSIEP